MLRITAFALVALLLPMTISPQSSQPKLLDRIDHLVYAAPDLELGVEELYQKLGVRATPGGAHPGRGTRNALLALGPTSYLEIIAPDPDQPNPAKARSFGLDDLKQSRLVTWAAKGDDLDELARKAKTKGIVLGEVTPGSRRRTDGVVLSWRVTTPAEDFGDGILPFFINWGDSPHPAQAAAKGLTLVEVRAEHPDADRVQQTLHKLGLDLKVTRGARPALMAVIRGPKGTIELR